MSPGKEVSQLDVLKLLSLDDTREQKHMATRAVQSSKTASFSRKSYFIKMFVLQFHTS